MKSILKLYVPLILSGVVGCSSTNTSQSGIVAAECKQTPIQKSDLTKLGITPTPRKITVVRMIGTWCPYCKNDLKQIDDNFTKGTWLPDTVEVFLIAYRSPKENPDTYSEFQSGELSQVNTNAIHAVYLDEAYDQLLKIQSHSGEPLLKGWKGVPFGLVFGKDGRLAFRGHFTMSLGFQNNHYKFITKLQKENCQP